MQAQIQKILIANRGEIAIRILRTAERLQIPYATVHSEPDASSLLVKLSKESYLLPGVSSKETYLNQDLILKACLETGCNAVHPGYGFLSENASFAELLENSGIIFIGPRPDSIRSMGDKIGSRKLVASKGVPVIPGYDGEDQNLETLKAQALKIGFPIMVKASAGGGGKGMRKVHLESELEASILSAKREALSAFGDDRVLIEKYVENPRHVEFQILGDSYGNIIHLHERDCSLQRRHQKVLEETPAPHLPSNLKAQMAKAAMEAANSVQYQNAGTVEFVLGESGEFYFLEMNTRLQVEHPITEMITGLDLVEWQIRIANGEKVPETPPMQGHAIEVRIYAEDPENQFLPSMGKILESRLPTGKGIRWDSSVENDSTISMHYDPMLAKLICHGEDRLDAIQKMISVLNSSIIFGVKTNISYVNRILQLSRFQEGRVSTHFLLEEKENLLPKLTKNQKDELFSQAENFKIEKNPWKKELSSNIRLMQSLRGDIGCFLWERDTVWIQSRGEIWNQKWESSFQKIDSFGEREIKSPMPGKVIQVFVGPGQEVHKEQPLCILEAMKMENVILAPYPCQIISVAVQKNSLVQQDQVLLELAPITLKKT